MNRQKILITGASHGIGKEAAIKFLKHDWEVFGCGSNRNDMRGVDFAAHNPHFHFIYADISVENDINRIFEWCGELDAAFNNAGVGCKQMPLHMLDLNESRRIMDINLLGTAMCMKYEIQTMLKRGGVIINNASVSAYKADTGADAMYSATKAGILQLTAEAAVYPLYREHIYFFSLVPGWVDTRMTAADDKKKNLEKLPLGRYQSPEEVANLVYAVVDNRKCFESGQIFTLTGGGIYL